MAMTPINKLHEVIQQRPASRPSTALTAALEPRPLLVLPPSSAGPQALPAPPNAAQASLRATSVGQSVDTLPAERAGPRSTPSRSSLDPATPQPEHLLQSGWPYLHVSERSRVGATAGALSQALAHHGKAVVAANATQRNAFVVLCVLSRSHVALVHTQGQIPVWQPSLSRRRSRGLESESGAPQQQQQQGQEQPQGQPVTWRACKPPRPPPSLQQDPELLPAAEYGWFRRRRWQGGPALGLLPGAAGRGQPPRLQPLPAVGLDAQGSASLAHETADLELEGTAGQQGGLDDKEGATIDPQSSTVQSAPPDPTKRGARPLLIHVQTALAGPMRPAAVLRVSNTRRSWQVASAVCDALLHGRVEQRAGWVPARPWTATPTSPEPFPGDLLPAGSNSVLALDSCGIRAALLTLQALVLARRRLRRCGQDLSVAVLVGELPQQQGPGQHEHQAAPRARLRTRYFVMPCAFHQPGAVLAQRPLHTVAIGV